MPTNKTLMVVADYIRDNTVINKDVGSELIEPFIVSAQNVRIESILGTGLFNDIITNINNTTIAGNNKTLLDDYIQPCLIQWVVYEALPFINYKLTNKSVSTQDSDNSTHSQLNEVQYLRENVRNTAEYMSQRLTDYLKSNTTLFPLYINPGNDCDTIRPNSSNYFNGIYLDSNDDCNYGLGLGIDLN